MRWGATVSEVRIRTVKDAFAAWQGFIIGRKSTLRSTLRPATEIAKVIGAIEGVDKSTDSASSIGPPKEREEMRQCVKMHEALYPHWRTGIRVEPLHLQIVTLVDAAEMQFVPQISDESRVEENREFVLDLADALSLARFSIAQRILPEETNPVVDDGLMIWRGCELAWQPQLATRIYASTARPLLRASTVPFEAKVRLCQALGDLGAAPFVSQTLTDMGPGHQFLQTVLYSRWQWDCTSEDVQDCVDKLSASVAGSIVENAAVETLLHLNQLPRIPPERLDRWYQSHVGNETLGRRLESCRILSLQPTGQAWLLDRLQRGVDAGEVRATAIAVMRQRAAATLAQQRWDFMTEDVCRAILALPNEQ